MSETHQSIVNEVINWFEKSVLGLNLCPFASKPYRQEKIRFAVSAASNEQSCLSDLLLNLKKLEHQAEIETLVLIVPDYLKSFTAYNEFLNLADLLLEQQQWDGVFQIASFHPDYCYADTDIDDRANWTNRSPYPLLHLLRESSITQAVQSHPDIDSIPQRNIDTLRSLSAKQFRQIYTRQIDKKIPG